MALTHLVDTSVLTRLADPAVREAIEGSARRASSSRHQRPRGRILRSKRPGVGPVRGGARTVHADRDHGRARPAGTSGSTTTSRQAPARTKDSRPADRRIRGDLRCNRSSLRRRLRPDRGGHRPTHGMGRFGRHGQLTPEGSVPITTEVTEDGVGRVEQLGAVVFHTSTASERIRSRM